MKPSPELIQFLKHSEGLSLKAYPDNGAYSIGYGHRSEAIKPGTVWTEQQAENALEWDANAAGESVSKLVLVPLTQGQFDCLCDFTFQFGAGSLHGSMLLAALNQGNYARVPLELYRIDPETGEPKGWVHVNGHVVKGLIDRRLGDIEFWNGGIPDVAKISQEASA